MATFIPPPNVDELVPPFIEHLPASLTSPQPPTSFYSFLCPILRQRLHLLSSAAPSESWISLLSWSTSEGSSLYSHLQSQDLTPHPSSGTLETGHVELNGIQRTDAETLRASVSLSDLGLEIVYIWSVDDPDGEDDGWMVLDVHLLSAMEDAKLFPTVEEAEEAFREEEIENKEERIRAQLSLEGSARTVEPSGEDGAEDDNYWNMYDRTPAETPVPRNDSEVTEEAYFDSYSEVEPAFGPGRVEEDARETRHLQSPPSPISSKSATTSSTPITSLSSHPHAPRPISADSYMFDQVKAVEASADSFHNELVTKQHISTSIKSLYRLSRGIGISQEEFASILQREIELLPLFDETD